MSGKHQAIPGGDRCRGCQRNEQACARTYPCCADCSHHFRTTLTRTCVSCGLLFDQPIFPGNARSCASCRAVRDRVVPLRREGAA